MASLLNKLRMLEAEPKKAPVQKQEEAEKHHFHHCQASFPLSLFSDPIHASPGILKSIFGFSFPETLKREDILFLDTETTGLSGGAGTVAFQIGVGYFTSRSFVVEQFLMHDYPEEPEMLQTVNAILGRFPIICTFNGRTFDVPLLRSRFLMNRIQPVRIPEIHADVLFPARRLWKLRLKKCTLANLEEQLLHVERTDDLPGALVPQTYFQYLKDGCFEPLERILEHNKQDIVSLAQLLFFMCRQVDMPEKIEAAEDLFSLARAMEKNGQRDKAMKCYRMSSVGNMRSASFQAMALAEKKAGNFEAAASLYQTMLKNGDHPVLACEALAILYEHRMKDLSKAIGYTRQALLLMSEPSLFKDNTVQERQIALQYRYARLRRRLSAAESK